MSRRILVGMSGGVDSAVAAYLLQQQGYELVAGFMKNYTDESNPNCHTREDRDMAIKVAQYLGIKTFVITDFREEYEQQIINYIYREYEQGRTPNPDVFCNNLIKFGLFLDEAKKLGCDAVATGHYAGSVYNEETQLRELHQGIDPIKDQSYFLSRLSQNQLAHAIFPLGKMMKSEVRELANQIGLPNATRPDSQGLCFIGNIPMREFLKKKLPEKPGIIINTQGQQVGTHRGTAFYTIGQRHGLDLPFQAYVASINTKDNIITVAPKDAPELECSECTLTDRHRIGEQISTPLQAQCKIRYRQTLQSCTLTTTPTGMKLHFDQHQQFIAPGQFGVVYQDGRVLGSGVIV